MLRTLVTRALAATFALPALHVVAATLPYYVSDSGSTSATAGLELNYGPGLNLGTTGTDGHNFSSGTLLQTSVTGTSLANASGTAYLPDKHSYVAQFAGGNVEDEANIGGLHSTISANTNSGGGTDSFNSGQATSHSSDHLTWGDNVFFTTSNPLGSYFTVALTLDIAIATSGTFGPFENGFFTGEATATLDIHGNINLDPSIYFHPTLIVAETKSLHSDGTMIDNLSNAPASANPSNTVGITFFVGPGQFVGLTLDATLQADAYANLGDGQALVDAGNTAQVSIHTDDPLATYTDSSGTVYDTTPETTLLPEPGTLSLLALAAFPLLSRRRR